MQEIIGQIVLYTLDNLSYCLLNDKANEDRQMTKTPKTLEEKIIEADERGGRYLAEANEAAERGNHEKAEKLYAKGQFWLDRSNKLLGNV